MVVHGLAKANPNWSGSGLFKYGAQYLGPDPTTGLMLRPRPSPFVRIYTLSVRFTRLSQAFKNNCSKHGPSNYWVRKIKPKI